MLASPKTGTALPNLCRKSLVRRSSWQTLKSKYFPTIKLIQSLSNTRSCEKICFIHDFDVDKMLFDLTLQELLPQEAHSPLRVPVVFSPPSYPSFSSLTSRCNGR